MKRMVYLAALLFFITGTHRALAQEPGLDHVPGEILVKYKSHISAASISERHAQRGIRTRRTFKRIRVHHLELPEGLSVAEALEIYKGDSNIEYAEPNYLRYATATIPDDTYFADLWGLHNDGTSGTEDADIDAPEAWDIAMDCRGVVIAVIDSGIDYDHEDLDGDLDSNIWSNPGEIPDNGIDDDGNGYVDDVRGWNFVDDKDDPDNPAPNDPMDTNDHGTHVAGTIAAKGDNFTGITGVCWTAQIMPLRFLNSSGSGTVADEISAIQYAIKINEINHSEEPKIKIINASFGSTNDSDSEKLAISAARDAGILFVAAAGNKLPQDPPETSYPAGYDLANIISVAATDQDDDLALFSNYGATWVDVGAPGVSIYSTRPIDLTPFGEEPYQYMSGTSMATPHVVGLAGLVWNTDTSLTHAEIKYVILDTVDLLASLSGKTVTGGRISAYNALLTSVPLLPPSRLSAAPVSGNQVDLSWADDSSKESGFKIERKVSGEAYFEIDTVDEADTTTYSDTSASEATSYTYRVRAYKGDSEYSDYSNEAGATTFPVAPTNLFADAVSSSQINLSWEDNSSGESGFKIERKTGSGGTYAQIATVGANVDSFSNSGLSGCTTYYYRVRAYNSGGDSDYSNDANATTDTPLLPSAPTGLSADAVSSSQINLSWEDNSSGESGFKIERKTGSGGTYAQIATVGANVDSFSNSGLSGPTTYYYRVRAYNCGGDSDYSNEANATTAAPPPVEPADDGDSPTAEPAGNGGGGGGGVCFIVTAGYEFPM